MEATEKVKASKKEIEVALSEVMSAEFFEDLIKYGISRLSKTFNIRYDIERGFRGIMLEDLIGEVIESFLNENGRNWYKADFPNFKKQFFSSYDSHICNTLGKELKKHIETPLFPQETYNIEGERSSTYEKDLNLALKILSTLGASDDEILLFEPYYVNNTKREVIAELFGLTVNEITQIKKKLDRKLPKLREELKKLNNED